MDGIWRAAIGRTKIEAIDDRIVSPAFQLVRSTALRGMQSTNSCC